MSISNNNFNVNGYLCLILGPMYSGKTSKLIEYIRKYKILNIPIITIKPSIDNRYTTDSVICSHNFDKEQCLTIDRNQFHTILDNNMYKLAKVIMIEEAQFFNNISDLVLKMVEIDKKTVYITALNGDFNRCLFGDIYKLIPVCDKLKLMHALCIKCNNGTHGVFSKRLNSNTEQILIGSNVLYTAVCRKHYIEK